MFEQSRTKNATRNIVFGFVTKIVESLFPFLTRMILIQTLGAEYLGLSSLFTSILQVLNLAELGFNSAIVYNMYKPIANKDVNKVCALLNFYKKVYRIIGFIVLTAGVIVLPFLPSLIKDGYPPSINIYVLYLIYLADTVLAYFLFAYKSALIIANQRNDILSKIQLAVKIFEFILKVVSLLVFKNYYVFVIVQVLGTICNNLLTAYISKKYYPEYICNGKISKNTKNSIRKKVFGLMIQKVCAMTRNSFDSIFISAMLGLTLVAQYSNYYMIMITITGLAKTVTSSILAGVGNSIATESEEKNYRDMIKFDFIYMWFSGWLTVCLACLYQPLMKIWMGEENMFTYDVVVLFCAYFYVLKMGDIRAVYADAKGLWYENRFRAIIESIVNVILNLLLGHFFGVYGIIAGTLISLFIIGFGGGSKILFKHYFVHEKISEYFMRHALYAFVTIVVSAITYFACLLVEIDGVLGLVIKALICVALPNLVYLIVYRNTRIYKEAAAFMRKILPKKKHLSI